MVGEGKGREEGGWVVAVHSRGGGEVEGKEMERGKGRRQRVRRRGGKVENTFYMRVCELAPEVVLLS
jgi:hypothetical protein